ENGRRLGELARLFADAGTIAIVAAVSPRAAGRLEIRKLHERDGLPFVEVFLNTPLSECIERDPNGTYRRALQDGLPDVPGIDQPYEPPEHPEVEITPRDSTTQAVDRILTALRARTGAAQRQQV